MTDWDEFYSYGWFAERYHWTPEQVDNLPHWCRVKYGRFASMWDEASHQD